MEEELNDLRTERDELRNQLEQKQKAWDGLVQATAKMLELKDEQLAETRGIAGELYAALEWAMGHTVRPANRIVGQNERYCDDYDSAEAALIKWKAAGISPEPKPARN